MYILWYHFTLSLPSVKQGETPPSTEKGEQTRVITHSKKGRERIMPRGVFSPPLKPVGYGLQHLSDVRAQYRHNRMRLTSKSKGANEYYREQYISAYINAQSNAMAHRKVIPHIPLSLYTSLSSNMKTVKGENTTSPLSCPGFGSWRTPILDTKVSRLPASLQQRRMLSYSHFQYHC